MKIKKYGEFTPFFKNGECSSYLKMVDAQLICTIGKSFHMELSTNKKICFN